MKRSGMLLVLAVAFGVAVGMPVMAGQSKADVTMRAADEKVAVEGDLREAIALYDQVLREAGSDRPLAARALLAKGEVQRKMGDPQSAAVFQEVLQKYPEQTAQVSAARAQLGAAARSSLITERVDVDAADVEGVSPDGRYLVRADVNLALIELETGTVREVTSDGSSNEPDHRYPLRAVFSPDGRQLAYDLFVEQEDRSILRTVRIADGVLPSQTIYDNPEIDTISPTDWSPDGRWIAVSIRRRDRTAQIGLIRVADGSLTVLRSVDWIGPSHMEFSPDSRLLAYDRPAAEAETDRDIFIIALDGSREAPVVVNPGDDRVVGWAPDGGRLLFRSDRSGTSSLWAVALRDGRPAAAAEYLSEFGLGRPIGITDAGVLYSKVLRSGGDIWVAPFDRQSGQLSAAPARLIRQFKGLNQMPEWSADGNYLAYVSKRDPVVPSPVVIVISSAETGDVVRELQPKASYLAYPRWSPDGRTFIARGADLKGRSGILRIDALTGETSLVVANETCSGVPYFAAAGRTFFCYDFERRLIVEMDVDTGTSLRSLPGSQGNTSPDGQFVAYWQQGLHLLPLSGGAPRQVLAPGGETQLGNLLTLTFTPDSRQVVFGGRVRDTSGMWLVDVNGGEPRKILMDASAVSMWRFNPKTWQVAFAPTNAPQFEIRRLEHFLPVAASTTVAR